MVITSDDIRKVALLARLGLTEAEIDKFAKEIGGILTYVQQLQAVDTTGVEPTYQVTQLVNVQREDFVEYFLESDRKKLVTNAPNNDGEYIRVKRVK